MQITITAQPSKHPVSVAELKSFLRVVDAEEDSTISMILNAAVDTVESLAGVACIHRSATITTRNFPSSGWAFPLSPISSIPSVKYLDSDGVEQTVSSSQYILEKNEFTPRLYLAADADWPSDVLDQADAVRIAVVAGYGSSPESVPGKIKQAILFMASHYYEMRSPVIAGTITSEVPMTVRSLIQSFKRYQT